MEGNCSCSAAFCESAALRESFLQAFNGLNSLSQSLTALTAPSGREPLARPEALRFSRKVYRYAKGPIPEGAVAVGDWGSSGKNPFRLAASRQATFPKGTALVVAGKLPFSAKASPWGSWLRTQ